MWDTYSVLRQGRHRNRAPASHRRSRGGDGRRRCTYQQIADELDYADHGTVHRFVREALSVTIPHARYS